MIGEINNGVVDTSVAGYVPSLARAEVVDFTQGFFKVTYATIIKRPSRTDFSLRYFWLGTQSININESYISFYFFTPIHRICANIMANDLIFGTFIALLSSNLHSYSNIIRSRKRLQKQETNMEICYGMLI